MKKRKSILSLILAVLMVIGAVTVLPFSVSAAGNGPVIEEDGYRAVYYTDGTAMLIEAKADSEHITVPSKIGDYTITEIAGAYQNNSKIKTVTIPDTVTGILGRSFENCKNLESVTMTDNVTLIRGSVFKNCAKLKSIDLSDNLTEIDGDAFGECHGLTEITIPESVTLIGSEAFAYCKNLATINVNKNPDLIIAGNAFIGTKWYNSQPNGVVYLDRFALSYKGGMGSGLKIDFKDGTTAVCDNMFYNSEFDDENYSLEAVTFPDTLTYIGENAFKKCVNLQNVTLPESLTHIGNSAFEGCTAIKSVTIPAGVKDLRHSFSRSGLESVTLKGNPDMWYYAFYECENLKEVILSENIENIHNYAFYGCKALETITLPESVQCIDGGAFQNCENLKEINHSGKIYKVCSYSFDNTAWEKAQPEGFVCFGDVILYYNGKDDKTMEELIIKDGIKGVADGAFADYKNLKKVVFPEGIKAIGAYSFRSTKVESIVIPESVEFIGYGAFVNCIELTSLDVKGGGVIEYGAFENCNNLKSVTISADIDEIGDDAFGKYTTFDGKVLVEGFTINGVEGSEAEKYAKENGISFVSLGETSKPATVDEILGDVNSDGKVNVKDATMIQKAAAKIITLTDAENLKANVNGDAKVNVKDATAIQKFAAKIETGFPIGDKIA